VDARLWHPVTTEGSLPLREGKRVVLANRELALFNLGDRYLAIDNQCPHKNGPLSDGIVSGAAVFCPLHNLKINLETGRAISGGEGCVKTYPVRVIDGQICIALSAGKFHESA
jgi:nitrite reductase (NADH) small subunit